MLNVEGEDRVERALMVRADSKGEGIGGDSVEG